jgi:hypothetical protein
MTENLKISLIISFIGICLVFCAIALLWLLISVLVKYSNKGDEEIIHLNLTNLHQKELLEKVAIAAVVTAIARQNDITIHEFPLPSTALVSAWQAVMRTDMLRKRGKTR